MAASEPTPSRIFRRPLRAAARILAVLLLLYLAGLAAASRRDVRAALRARIEAALRARLGVVTLGDDIRLDPLFRVAFGPISVPGVREGGPPLVRVELVKIRADLLALLRGRIEPASIRLYDVRVELPPGEHALADALDRLRAPARRSAAVPAATAAAGASSQDAPIHVNDLVIAFTMDDQRVEAGPVQLSVHRGSEGAGQAIAVALRFPGSGQGEAVLRRDAAGWHGTARLERLGPEIVPAALRDGPVTWSRGQVRVELSGDVAPDLRRARGTFEVEADGLFLGGEVVASEPLGPLAVRFGGRAAWDGAERRFALTGGRVSLPGPVEVVLEAEARLGPGVPFTLSARADGLDYAAATAALPPALAPPAAAPRPAGTLDARVSLAGPLVAPGAWAVDASLDLSRMREEAHRAPPVALCGPFVHHPEVERGPQPGLLVGPGNPSFVPLAELPGYVVRAVTASEDAGFFGHSGFDFDELRKAAVQGAEAGRVVRGGSTITQQLAKNLYLSREKTLTRKLREAVLTVALEATVPKHRLLEIYLNVAQWGPGLWGIGPAARHWFGKDARALTPKEAAFLATVIPNPVRYHYMWSRGSLSAHWEQHVRDLLLTMGAQGALSPDALAEALDQPLAFAGPSALRGRSDDDREGGVGTADPLEDDGVGRAFQHAPRRGPGRAGLAGGRKVSPPAR